MAQHSVVLCWIGGDLCYTLRMFIHHVFITGCSDRGAWPWRMPVFLNA